MTDRQPTQIEVSVPRGRVRRRDFVVHHSRDLCAAHVRQCSDINVTMPTRVVLDIAGTDPLGTTARIFDAGLRRELFEPSDVDRLVGRVARSGRPGIRTTRLLVAERLGWIGRSQSEMEDKFRRLLTRGSIAQPEAQHIVCDSRGRFVARLDFAYTEQQIAIELDSWSFHRGLDEFQRDRSRQNDLVRLGWTVIRFTWNDLARRPRDVLTTLGALIRA